MAKIVEANHGSGSLGKSLPIGALLYRCRGAYADATIRGYGADLRLFEAWCTKRGRCWLPAKPETVAAFIDHEIELLSAATLKRRVSAIKFAHRITDLPDPSSASVVFLALRRAARRKSRRPAQASGLTAEVLRRILRDLQETPAGLRDAALISVGYDTLCRSCELAAMRVEDLRRSTGSEWSVLITRSKGDQAGDGRIAWLSPNTVDRLQRWMEAAEITRGPLFRSLHTRKVSKTALDSSSIRRLVKRAAQSVGIEEGTVKGLSGHSMRVGAAQDMLVAGFDALAIMQAGGWKSTNVLLRYVENASTRALHERRWQFVGFLPNIAAR
jgi:integrase/recombinase XerD